MSQNNSEYGLSWPIIDAGAPGEADQFDVIEGRPPEGREDIPALIYANLDPTAPENLVNVTAFTRLWYSYLPMYMREADEVQNPMDGGWPMLRWMDSIGHIADGVRATTQDMYDGKWTNPATVPDRAVPWLASVLGVPRSQKNIPGPQLRQVLTDMIENGRAPTGTRSELAAAAKQFLLGEKQAVVRPQVSLPRSLNNEDLALGAAMGYAGRVVAVHVSSLPPGPAGTVDDIWVRTTDDTVHTSDGTTWTLYTATDVSAERAAVQAKRETETFLRAHTIVIIVRPDEVPDGDLVKFAANLRNVGVVPAGHALVVVTAQATWDSYQAAMDSLGGSWNAYEAATSTWQDNDALGLSDLGSV